MKARKINLDEPPPRSDETREFKERMDKYWE